MSLGVGKTWVHNLLQKNQQGQSGIRTDINGNRV